MGLHKDEGDALSALAEECAEVIQVISKLKRFGGSLDEVPPGKLISRKQQLVSEMGDLMYQWDRVLKEHYKK